MRSLLRKAREYGRRPPARIVGWVSLPFFALFCVFVADYFNYYTYDRLVSVFHFVDSFPLSYLFAVIFVCALLGLLLLICRKAVIACGVLGAITLVCSYVNYMKLALNGDNFLPRDVVMVKNGGELLDFVSESMPGAFFAAAAVIVIACVLYAVFDVELPLSWKIRVPAAAVLAVCVFVFFWSPSVSEGVFNAFGMKSEDTILQSSNYRQNGFTSAFVLNISAMQETTPDGYSRDAIEGILAPYGETAQTGEDFDVIVVLGESFADIRKLPGLTFSENVLSNFDNIAARPNAYSGSFYTTGLGGGTVRPEFAVLTGLSADYMHIGASPYEKVTAPLDTYVTNYRDAGYRTVCIHPYDKKFYTRDVAYPFIGIDEFYGETDVVSLFHDGTLDYEHYRWGNAHLSDESTAEMMKYILDTSDKPTFLFTITMQNHQPYKKSPADYVRVEVTSDVIGGDLLDSVTTYTQGVYDTDRMLGELVDYIDGRERPTILLFFGDHWPTLGANYAAYNKTGFVDSSDGFDHDEAMKIYSTPFLIYSNREIEIPMLSEHKNVDLTANNALNAVAEATGFRRTPFMAFLADFHETAPAYNVRLQADMTDELTAFDRALRLLTYDRVVGKNYSEGK